jgi:hypothetical protein
MATVVASRLLDRLPVRLSHNLLLGRWDRRRTEIVALIRGLGHLIRVEGFSLSTQIAILLQLRHFWLALAE